MRRLKKETGGLKEVQDIVEQASVITEQGLEMANWISEHYVSSLGQVLRAMLPKYMKKPASPPLEDTKKTNPDFVLTEHQRGAVTAIGSALGKQAKFLLFGVTGSGKTEVYLQVIERLLAMKKQSLVLVPEISLTPQALDRLSERFGSDKVAILHSQMKNSERYWMWRQIRDGNRQIVVGPRSAVFAPFYDLGLIVVDEEHDSSYKQYEQNPKYHARSVAEKLSELWRCPLVLGDATPSVETFHEALQGRISVLTLPHRIKADVGMPAVKMVDMKRELLAGNTSIFSEELKGRMLVNLRAEKQIILFLNRRGSARVVMCRDCGFVATCSHCSSPLVWHTAINRLLCHHCDALSEMPEKCPSCAGHRIKQFGIGTQKIEEELIKFLKKNLGRKKLPKIVRMDRDSTAKRGSGKKMYEDWRDGKTSILIGTQMISKGWDVSNVGLVGVVSADSTLYLPDYRSNERTFQVLAQVAGRAGRGKDLGSVIIQTYHPENYAVRAVKTHDYRLFYDEDIAQRAKYGYPPFFRLVKIVVSDKSFEKAKQTAGFLARELLSKRSSAMELVGPSPAFMPKLRGRFRFQVILKLPAASDMNLYEFFKNVKTKADIDVDPESLL
jgi:primosomal protein N' (replication factor Y)